MLLNLVRTEQGLTPIDDTSVDAVKKIPLGKEVNVEWKPKRNYKNHKRFFSMLQGVINNSDHYKSIDNLLDMLKLKTGYFETVITHKAETYYIPKSIAFHAMKEDEFNEFFSKCIDIILEFTPEQDIESILRYC